MADDREAEIRNIKLKIENLWVAANYSVLPQAATVAYLKELQTLRQRLQARSNVQAGLMTGKPSEAQITAMAARQSWRSSGRH